MKGFDYLLLFFSSRVLKSFQSCSFRSLNLNFKSFRCHSFRSFSASILQFIIYYMLFLFLHLSHVFNSCRFFFIFMLVQYPFKIYLKSNKSKILTCSIVIFNQKARFVLRWLVAGTQDVKDGYGIGRVPKKKI